MTNLKRRWDACWFIKEFPEKLAVFRIVMFGTLLTILWKKRYELILNRPCETYKPFGVYSLFDMPCSLELLQSFYWISVFMGVCAFLGVAYRVSGKLASISAALFLGYQYNFTEVYHSFQLFCLVLIIVGFSLANRAYSVDGLIFKMPKKKSIHFGWPLKLSATYVVYVYFIVGLEKLYYGGYKWVFSENLLLMSVRNPQSGLLTEWFQTLPYWAIVAMAFWSLVVCELLAPLALWKRLYGYLFFFIWISFHLGVHLILGGHKWFFCQLAAASVFLLPLLDRGKINQEV